MDIFTESLLAQYVENSDSISEVIRKFGLEVTGSRHRHVKSRIARFGISTAHFDFGASRIQRNKGFNKKHFTDVLIYGSVARTPSLKRALIEAGKVYICEICSISPIWENKDLTLQIDHKNGNRNDNTFGNLRFLCPNCHSQTPTYSNKKRNVGTEISELPPNLCIICQIKINKKSIKCRKCHLAYVSKNQVSKIKWPSLEKLDILIMESNKLQVSKKLGISWTALEKHIRRERQKI